MIDKPGRPSPEQAESSAGGAAPRTLRGSRVAARSAVRLARRFPGIGGSVHLARRSLRESGWLSSYRSGKAVDRAGRPLPWYTYPAIHLLETRLPADSAVFEYGAGHSTLWYGGHCRRVVSVEHDQGWYEELVGTVPPNVEIELELDPELYVSASSRRRELYDLIAIDGELRAECATVALRSLSPRGVMVWDNSDWEPFLSTFPRLLEPAGFRQLELRGMGPVSPITWSTSILYRSGSNCLGI